MACPLQSACFKMSGMNCTNRDFKSCLLYNSVLLERKRNNHGIWKKLDAIPTQQYLK